MSLLTLIQLSVIEKIKRAPSLIKTTPLDTVTDNNVPYNPISMLLELYSEMIDDSLVIQAIELYIVSVEIVM